MGILNVTPDSFSDGLPGAPAEQFITKAKHLIDEGADIIDIGGESTRPGALPVDADEEIRRVLPVMAGLRDVSPFLPISLDTRKLAVAEACAGFGISILNDVGFASDERLVRWAAKHRVAYVLMHSRGTPETMTKLTDYPEGLLPTMFSECAEKIARVTALGIDQENLILDPGFGFAKTPAQCRDLAENLAEWPRFLARQETPATRLMIGVSRKRFLQSYTGTGDPPPGERDVISASLAMDAFRAGFHVIRTHNVALTRKALCL
jgi:dihydropteroate synthase